MAKTSDRMDEIIRKKSEARMRVRTYKSNIFDRPHIPLTLKVRVVKAKAAEALLYGCVMWNPAETTTPNSAT